jgi:hypothetical protein
MSGFDLNALSTYTDELSFELISKAVLETDLMNEIAVRTGLQAGTVAINLFEGDLNVSDLSCGWVSSGTMSLTQVDIVIRDKQVKMEACPQDLRAYYTSQLMSASAHQESIPFEAIIADYYVQKIKNYNEGYLIAGDGTGLGIKQQIGTSSTTNIAATASWTPTTALDLALDLYDAIDESVKDRNDLIMVMSPARYRILLRALVKANYFHYDSVSANNIVELPGTNCKIVKSSGLVGSDYMFAGPAEFIVAGTGLTDDMSSIRFFYDQGEDIVKIMAKWRLGVSIHQPNLFSTNALA